MSIIHVAPINDLSEHIQDTTCACSPTVEVLDNGDMLIVHNAYDKREENEK